jgi:acetyl-CoA carboxylase biotin carboxyl carrier protein
VTRKRTPQGSKPAGAAVPRDPKPADNGRITRPPRLGIDQDLVRELARLLDETGLTEIEFQREGERVRVARHLPPPIGPAPTATPPDQPPASPAIDRAGIDPENHPGLVTSPMVGTAYFAPKPGERPFVEIGSRVTAGETLLIIEAMKTMNQIPAPRAGTVIQILIEDGQPVEFGEALMIIE